MGQLGWVDTEIHTGPYNITDYRGQPLQGKLSKARQLSFPLGFDTSINLIGNGQFSVGHIPFSGRNLTQLKDFQVLFAIRRWRDCLASFMHFEARRIGLDPKRLPAAQRSWVERDTPQEQFLGYLDAFGEGLANLTKSMIPWLNQERVLPVRFEDISGEFGKKAQEDSVREILEYLEVEATEDALRVVLGCVNVPTLTFSGGRSSATDVWSPEAQKKFQSLGGPWLEKRMGYD